MQQPFRILLKHTLLTSLTPLSLYALISGSEHLLRLSLSNSDPQNNLESLSFYQGDHHGPQVLISLLSFLISAKALILNAYSSVLSFFVMMAIINMVHLAGSLLILKSDENKVASLHDICTLLSLKRQINNENTYVSMTKRGPPSFRGLKRISQRVILYAIFYYCLTFAVSAIGSSSTSIANFPPKPVSILSTLTSHDTIPMMINDNHFRLLQEQADSELFSSNNLLSDITPDIRRLSIGKALSSLRLSPIAVTLSKDSQLAFIILRYSGTLKVIDISNDENPIIIGSLDNLAKIEYYAYYDFKKLVLSADGKTLFATNVQYLEIIDVSDPQNPTLITTLEDSVHAFKTGASHHVPKFCIPTIALSSDETTFYVASIGLQIINVTNTSNPEVLYSYIPPQTPRKMTSLALFPNSKTLLFGNGTLDFYDVSDPKNPKLISSYENPDLHIYSIRLSKTLKKVYAVGITLDESTAILEEIDVSQPTSPQSIDQYEIAIDEVNRIHYPSIIGLSPNETNIFVMWGFLDGEPDVEMIGFDLVKKQVMPTQPKNLFAGAKIFEIIPGTHNIITNSNNQFHIIKLFKDYPNTINFCLTNNSRGTYQFPSKRNFVESSPDSNFLFAFSPEGVFESYAFTSSPQQLLTSFKPFNYANKFAKYPFKIIKNLAICQSSNGFDFLDISNPANIPSGVRLPGDPSWNIRAFAHSPQENFLVAWTRLNTEYRVKIVDFSKFPSITETPLFNYTSAKSYIQFASLSNKGKIIYFLHENFTIYNISDFNNPKVMFSKPLAPFEYNSILISMTLSPDDKTLFILLLKSSMESSFVIIDVSDLKNPKVLSVMDMPKGPQDTNQRPFILSRDMKRGFLTTSQDLLVINLQNMSSPVVLGKISYSSLGIEEEEISISNFFISPDEKRGYLSDFKGRLFQVNIDIPYTLYLPQEKFLLGKKSSENLLFLQSDDNKDFLPTSSSDYKITKLLLFDLHIISSKDSPVTSNSSLPSWITFDYDNQALTVESKKQRELGSYTLYSFTSKKIPRQVFGSDLTGSITSEDMVTLLVSLGYLDNQRFLTSGFGSYEDFLLPSQYNGSQETVYKTLQSYRIETFTDFTVIPSLTLVSSEKLSLKTPSENSIKVGIKLHNTEAKFIQKTYSTLQPVITDQKSRLTFEGPLDLVNEALKDLVVNLNNTKSCAGEITINDQLNPPISQYYKNLSEYFFKNEPPAINTSHPLTLQKQIDLNTLYTGQSFSISIDPQTFMDAHSEVLSYELIREASLESKRNLPSWITYNGGLTIKGIPPEDWMNREIHLVLIVKNEFKQIEVPFVLNIHISMVFAAKLLMRYSPYLLTALGLLVSANKIINISCKKRYRHSKDVSVRVGEEITSNIIFPMRFIAEEKAEGELILRNLLFNEEFDEEKIRATISNIVKGSDSKVKQNFKLYLQEGSGQKRVEQYVLNQAILQQLNSPEEKSTKNLFDKIKEDWAEFIEYDEELACFKIHETHLDNLLAQIQQKTNQTSTDYLLSSTNLDLLKKALVVYVTKQHEIDELEWKVAVELKMKIPGNSLFSFLKLDLQRIPNSEKSQKAYGIDYHIQEDHLIVSGTPHANFEGKTVVLQVFSDRQRIRKELWIHGISNSANDVRKRMSSLNNSYNVL